MIQKTDQTCTEKPFVHFYYTFEEKWFMFAYYNVVCLTIPPLSLSTYCIWETDKAQSSQLTKPNFCNEYRNGYWQPPGISPKLEKNYADMKCWTSRCFRWTSSLKKSSKSSTVTLFEKKQYRHHKPSKVEIQAFSQTDVNLKIANPDSPLKLDSQITSILSQFFVQKYHFFNWARNCKFNQLVRVVLFAIHFGSKVLQIWSRFIGILIRIQPVPDPQQCLWNWQGGQTITPLSLC